MGGHPAKPIRPATAISAAAFALILGDSDLAMPEDARHRPQPPGI
jgi:hypothetical protein